MTALNYNEDDVLAQYLVNNFANLMTEFESRSLKLAMKREKAAASEGSGEIKLRLWLGQETEQVIQASKAGCRPIMLRFKERVLRDVSQNDLFINRCPACDR